MTDRLLGVVLCGGRSSRMGQDKSTLAHPSGVTFLNHAIDRLTTLCQEVCLSGTAIGAAGLHVLPDPTAYQGPVTGIATALCYAHRKSFDACLITPVDMPNLTNKDLAQLVKAWTNEGQLTLAESERTEPLVGIYPVALREKLEQLACSEDRSLSRWLLTENFHSVTLSLQSCRNINTPEDLAGGR